MAPQADLAEAEFKNFKISLQNKYDHETPALKQPEWLKV